MAIRAEILQTGTIARNNMGGYDANGWSFGSYPLSPWVDQVRGLMAGWPFEFLHEIYNLVGQGCALEQCVFCGAPTLPDNITMDVFIGDMFTKLYGREGVRVAARIGPKVLCSSCYADLANIISRVNKE